MTLKKFVILLVVIILLIGAPCWDKADLTIWCNDRDEREEIDTFLSEDLLFFGIPVNLDGQYDR